MHVNEINRILDTHRKARKLRSTREALEILTWAIIAMLSAAMLLAAFVASGPG